MKTQTIKAPRAGEDPEFDRFAAASLKNLSNLLDRERRQVVGHLSRTFGEEQDAVVEELLWEHDRARQLRAELWETWQGRKSAYTKSLQQRLREADQRQEESDRTIADLLAKGKADSDTIKEARQRQEESNLFIAGLLAKGKADGETIKEMSDQQICRKCYGRVFDC